MWRHNFLVAGGWRLLNDQTELSTAHTETGRTLSSRTPGRQRLEDALSDCIWAQKHMRKNTVIDYKQLGLRFKLYSWQVLHNAAAAYCRMGQWEQATEVLLQGGGAGHLEAALDSIERRELPTPLTVPESLVFRPRKQEVEQLQKKDFLGKAKVISSLIPNDDFGGFEPLRQQRPGFYEPKADRAQESRYMRVRTPYMARAPEQLTVPGGVVVFLFGEEDRDGMINVIYDGQRGLLPVFLLEPAEVNAPKAKNDNRVPSGIPLPPGLQPPGRPQAKLGPAAPSRETPPPSPITSPHAPPSSTLPLKPAASTGRVQHSGPPEEGSVVVKVHYTYTVAVTVPLNTPYHELKQRIAQKLGHPASELCLRHKQQGSHLLSPLSGEPGGTVQDLAVAGRATLWCQKDDPLVNRHILYQMVALYNYDAQGPEDLEFSEGDTIDILSEVNEEWLEGHCAGNVGIFPSCFAYRENSSLYPSHI
ncbi:NADPH oxidase activator 1 isoform X3 [Oryzias latipes]|uniref:NADPH oxidase activator 1 isoform X3 n=1 Tax=Oryzias latipes TaxID=8090 RepID=UPI0009DA16BA|nr:NADPH oxidase activator 1 isoform X3 [Oryzias latipes]